MSAAPWSAPAGLTVPGLTILGHPQVQRVGERAVLLDLASGRDARLSRREPEFSPPGRVAPQPLAVPHLSRRPVHLSLQADGGIRLNRGDCPTSLAADGEPILEARTFTAEEVARGVVLLLAQQVVLLLHRFRPVFPAGLERYGLIGESDAMLDLYGRVGKVADLAVPVMLRGETGTGKELLAQALHRASCRRARPYFAVNLGAIPPSLAAAELFGAARGAFTGADQARRGYFRRADGGTLFLDELGEAPQEIQPLLLRALENGEVQPLGTEETVRVDVRIITATDANLEREVAAGRFRAPLLHRLSGYELRLPALRDRRDDVGRLLYYFLRQELAALGEGHRLADTGPDGKAWIPAPLVARLAAAAWPGNVRQLRNAARHLAIEARGSGHGDLESLLTPYLERLLGEGEAPAAAGSDDRSPIPEGPRRRAAASYRAPQEVSEEELRAALRANRWHPGAAARQLGISRPSLYVLLDSFPSLRKAADLPREDIARASARCGGRCREMAELLEVSEAALKRRMKQLGIC